jgi:hypothetical protein
MRFQAFSLPLGCVILFGLAAGPACVALEPTPQAASAFNAYVSEVESRLDRQHRSQEGFVVLAAHDSQSAQRLRKGELVVERLTPSPEVAMPGAMLHHWRGTVFLAGAKAADLEPILRDFNTYPQHFAPQVLKASSLSQGNDSLQSKMRIRQKHILTVVMDMNFDVIFGRLDPQHEFSSSRSTRVAEIASAGSPSEHALSPADDHGFLWRLNTYWTWEERDGGLYMQIESISMTRSIPRGLGWSLGPFVESVPRESLEFTLRSAENALHK